MRKQAFTLAEIMIVLAVIGVLTAILLPVAQNSMPNEDVLRFKKAHKTFTTLIRELVNSDKYYADGDLGMKANKTLVSTSTYLCETMSDVLNAKKTSCSNASISNQTYQIIQFGAPSELTSIKNTIDTVCIRVAPTVGEEIQLQDNTVFYQSSPKTHFGITNAAHSATNGGTITDSNRLFLHHVDSDGFPKVYKIMCIDIDGIPSKATNTNCVNECPFGYALRVDGKIIYGKRATEWLEKSDNERD